jgi:hypothetical protein
MYCNNKIFLQQEQVLLLIRYGKELPKSWRNLQILKNRPRKCWRCMICCRKANPVQLVQVVFLLLPLLVSGLLLLYPELVLLLPLELVPLLFLLLCLLLPVLCLLVVVLVLWNKYLWIQAR